MLIAGALIDTPWGENISFRDNRVSAFVAISPIGTGQQGLNRHSWDKVNTPVMTISGSEDAGYLEGQPPSWRLEPFQRMPAGNKYHILIQGANHFSFSDFPFREELHKKRIHAFVEVSTIAFWDAYLKQENRAIQFLKSNALATASRGRVSLMRK